MVLVCGIAFGSLVFISSVSAVAPLTIINYQGRLLNTNGTPVTDSTASVVFKFYDAISGGSCLWSNSSASCATEVARTVTLTQGLFSEDLGDSVADTYAAISDTTFADNTRVYLEVVVGGETLTPRKRIVAAPYAMNAKTIAGIGILDLDFDQIFSATDKILNLSSSDLEFSLDDSTDLLFDLQDTGAVIFQDVGTAFFSLNADTSIVQTSTASADPAFLIDANADTGLSIDENDGGALHISNTDNDHYGLTVYTNRESPNTPLVRLISDHISSGQSVLQIDNDGAGAPAVYIDSDGNESSFYISSASTTTNTSLITASAQTTGNIFDVLTSSADRTSGDLFEGSHSTTYTTSKTVSGSGLDLDQTITINGGGETVTVSGHALDVRATGTQTAGTLNWTGSIAYLDQNYAAATGAAAHIQNAGTGQGILIEQFGDATALDINGTGTTGFVADFFNDGNLDANGGIKIQACLDSNPTTACNLIEFQDGNGTILGAIEGDGAGGVTNASAGGDYAELFPGTLSDVEKGDILALNSSGQVVSAANAEEILGAYSVAPNVLGNWSHDWRVGGAHVPVALLGQVPVRVSVEGGAISAGDYITLSSTSGVGMRSPGPGYVLGRALESHASGTAIIQVYVSAGWHAGQMVRTSGARGVFGDDFVFDGGGTATAEVLGVDSSQLAFLGSGFDGAAAQDVELTLYNDVRSSSDYGLALDDLAGSRLFEISNSGDLYLSGNIYPSDRGEVQTDRYLYYDGSEGPAGDMIRTNASGWGTGSYDYAEMFPSNDVLNPGDVVVFGNSAESIMRSTGTAYDPRAMGIVSTRPGFVAGDNIEGHVPVALAGRVPTYVSVENGSIAIGDPLTTSSTPGHAMKATEAGRIIGYAMESFSSGFGQIVVFVDATHYSGADDFDILDPLDALAFDVSSPVDFASQTLFGVGSILGAYDRFRIEEDGTFRTDGAYIHRVTTDAGDVVDTYASLSTERLVELSGRADLVSGFAHISFEDIDASFNDIILDDSYRVLLTASGATGPLYADGRSLDGFDIRESAGSSSTTVDWLVIAYHKDYVLDAPIDLAPAPVIVPPSPAPIPVEDIVDDPIEGEVFLEEIEDVPVEWEIVEEIDDIDEPIEVPIVEVLADPAPEVPVLEE